MKTFLMAMLTIVSLIWGGSALAQALHDSHSRGGVPCASCHVGEQVPSLSPPDAVCVACHGSKVEPLEPGEQISRPDPHRSPHLAPGEAPACTSCHSIHGQSEVTCLTCHRGFEFNRE